MSFYYSYCYFMVIVLYRKCFSFTTDDTTSDINANCNYTFLFYLYNCLHIKMPSFRPVKVVIC